MATFNYTVDTEPMAQEMSSVSRHVSATTGAVVAMQTAVIIAEEKAANHVCNNVNKGFYSLILSQISQKMAKLQSEVDSQLMQLVQQKKALLGIKKRMERDYNMIAGRYLKLFNGLNSNLKQRVFELDKPTIDFSVKEVDKISNRKKYLTATIPITQLESIAASQKIIASNVKFRGLNVINSMKSFIQEMNTQKKITEQILINDDRFTETATVFIPIAIVESRKEGSDVIDIQLTNIEMDRFTQSMIINKASTEVNQLNWKDTSDNNQDIESEFSKLLSGSSKSQRIKDQAAKLFQSARHQTL